MNLHQGDYSGGSNISEWLNLTQQSSHGGDINLYKLVMPIVGVVVIVINLLVVISSVLVIKQGAQPKTTYMFLGNLAMADLIEGVAILFGAVYPPKSRTYYTCIFEMGLIVSSTLASVWSVTLIAVDRFLYIVYGLKYDKIITKRSAKLFILADWVIALIIGYSPLVYPQQDKVENGKVCLFTVEPKPIIAVTVVWGILPILINIVLYSFILKYSLNRINKEELSLGTRSNNGVWVVIENKGRGWSQAKWKAFKIVFFTNAVFIITWMPYFIACTMFLIVNGVKLKRLLQSAIASPLAILGFFNSLLNPIIYVWWHRSLLRYGHYFLCCTKNNQEIDPTGKTNGEKEKNKF